MMWHKTSRLLAGLFVLVSTISLYAQDDPPALDYTTSWFGNSFGNANRQWVQNFIESLYVLPNGIVLGIGEWDEGTGEITLYASDDGNVEGRFAELHGWGRGAPTAATHHNEYVYVAMSQNGCDGGDDGLNDNGLARFPACKEDQPEFGWYVIRRYTLDGMPAPFPLGYGHDGSMMIVTETTTGAGALRGLEAYDDRLYVSDTDANRILVYDLLEFGTAPIAEWSVPKPHDLTFRSDGTLFVLSDSDGAAVVLRFTTDGTPQGAPLTLPVGVEPTALALDAEQRLFITDNGIAQQVRIYEATGDTFNQVGTFGEAGGVTGAGGVFAPLRFNNLSGIGIDEAGILYISENDNTVLSAYRMDGERLWSVYSNEFVDSAVFDPLSDGTIVYTGDTRYTLDYSQVGGNVGTAEAFTLDRFQYPTDPRNEEMQTPFALRWLDGQKFLYNTDMYATAPIIYRFEGETAVPAGIFYLYGSDEGEDSTLGAGLWLWRDLNGDEARTDDEHTLLHEDEFWEAWGIHVDSRGGVWFTPVDTNELFYFPYGGLDEHGSPIYDPAAMVRYTIPVEGYWQRVMYDADSDTMYIGGYVNDEGRTCWGLVGTEVLRFDGWLSGEQTLHWTLDLPHTCGEEDGVFAKAMTIAGDYLFTVDGFEATVRVYDLETAEPIGTMSPGPEVGRDSGWIDIPYALHAVQRADGTYVLTVEEDAFGKIIVYTWDGVAP